MDLNRQEMIGRLVRDPEQRESPVPLTTFTVATSYSYTNKSGEKVEDTMFHNVTTWNKLAEIAAQYLRKGQQVYVDGRTQQRKYTDKDGIDRWSHSVVANSMIMLARPKGQETPQPPADEAPQEKQTIAQQVEAKGAAIPTSVNEDGEETIRVEDIPF